MNDSELGLLRALTEWVISFEERSAGETGPSPIAVRLRQHLAQIGPAAPEGPDEEGNAADAAARKAVQKLGAPSSYREATPAGMRFPAGTPADEVMKALPVLNIPEMVAPGKVSLSSKLVSLYAAVSEVTIDADWAEFGVYKGRGARFLTQFVPAGRRLHLFDSFEGLPENWADKWGKGHFGLGGQAPEFDPAVCVVHKGWFSDTAEPFARQHHGPLALIHMDADLYSSTMDAFRAIDGTIVPGTILLFDEYVTRGHDDEHRALIEWQGDFSRSVEYLWRTRRNQVAVRVVK